MSLYWSSSLYYTCMLEELQTDSMRFEYNSLMRPNFLNFLLRCLCLCCRWGLRRGHCLLCSGRRYCGQIAVTPSESICVNRRGRRCLRRGTGSNCIDRTREISCWRECCRWHRSSRRGRGGKGQRQRRLCGDNTVRFRSVRISAEFFVLKETQTVFRVSTHHHSLKKKYMERWDLSRDTRANCLLL